MRLAGEAEEEPRRLLQSRQIQKIFGSALETTPAFSSFTFAASRGAGRQIGSGGLTGRRTGVLRSFVSTLLFGGLGYEDHL